MKTYRTLDTLKKSYKNNWDLIDSHIKNVIARSKVSSRDATYTNSRSHSRLTTLDGARSVGSLHRNNFNHFKDMYASEDKLANKIRNHELLNTQFDIYTSKISKKDEN